MSESTVLNFNYSDSFILSSILIYKYRLQKVCIKLIIFEICLIHILLLIQINKFRKMLINDSNDSNHSSTLSVLVVSSFTKKEERKRQRQQAKQSQSSTKYCSVRKRIILCFVYKSIRGFMVKYE